MSEDGNGGDNGKDDLSFWMSSDDQAIEVSSDEDEKPKEPEAPMATRSHATPQATPKKIVDDLPEIEIVQIEDDDDVPYQDDVIQTRRGRRISKAQQRMNYNDDYDLDIHPPKKKAVEEDFVDPNKLVLNSAINSTSQMIADIIELANDDSDIPPEPIHKQDSVDDVVIMEPSDPSKKVVQIISQENGNKWIKEWDQKETFEQLLYKISSDLRNSQITFSGIEWKINEVTWDIVSNGEEIYLSQAMPDASEAQNTDERKLSFLLPDGTKKKLKVPLNKTWGYVLKQIGTGSKLMFDGEKLNLNEKIGNNHDIEDEDQIDVL